MIETKEVDIGQHQYRLTQLTSKAARKMAVRLGRVLGPALGEFISGISGAAGSTPNTMNLGVGLAISQVMRSLSEDDLEEACKVFGGNSSVLVDGKWQNLDSIYQEVHFAGAFGELIEWIAESVAWNYSDFFALLAKEARGVLPTAGGAGESQKTKS